MKIKRNTTNPLTKDDLKQIQTSIEKIGEKIGKVEKELYITQKLFRLEIISSRSSLEKSLDKVMSEFRKDVSIHQSEEIKKQIDTLEKKFAKLEKKSLRV